MQHFKYSLADLSFFSEQLLQQAAVIEC